MQEHWNEAEQGGQPAPPTLSYPTLPTWPRQSPGVPKQMSGDRKALIALVAALLLGGGGYFIGSHHGSGGSTSQQDTTTVSEVLNGTAINTSISAAYATAISASRNMYGGVDLFHGTDQQVSNELVAAWDRSYHDLQSMPEDVFEASWGDKTSSGMTNLMNWFVAAGMSRQGAADEASFVVQTMRSVWQAEHGTGGYAQ